MKLLNLCCGATRPGAPWTNLDSLRAVLKSGTPERTNLDRESNYVDFDALSGPLPFPDNEFDGILASHCVEHWDCQQAAMVLAECRRVLKLGGLLVVSVPDARYFLQVHRDDTPERAVELFGEPICPAEPWHKSFFDYALFNEHHKQVLTEGGLMCLLIRAGFAFDDIGSFAFWRRDEPLRSIEAIMNRRKFSIEMCAVK